MSRATPTRGRALEGARSVIALLVILTALAVGLSPTAARADATAPPVELLVGFAEGVTPEAARHAYEALGATHVATLRAINVHRVRVRAAEAAAIERALGARPGVLFVERDRLNATQETPARVPDELLVGYEAWMDAPARDAMQGLVGAARLAKLRRLRIDHLQTLPGSAAAAGADLAAMPGVAFVESQRVHGLTMVPNDTSIAQEWHLSKIQAWSAWDWSRGANVTIAILDTGVDPSHPELASKLVPGYNLVDGNTNTADVHGHGTKVAGTAAALGNNSAGVAGVAWASRIMPVRIADAEGYGFTSTIANGITWAADHGARVVNISLGGVAASSTITTAARYAATKGTVVVAGAGNCGCTEAISENPYILSVSATDSSDNLASFSSRGNYVDVAAPGVGIYTTTRGGGYASVSGTSFSGPVAAGIAALMISANPRLTAEDILSLLKANADERGTAGWDPNFGYGRVNAARAVAAAVGSSSATAPAPSTLPPPDVQAFRAVDTATGGRLSLSWDDPTAAAGALVLRRAGSPVADKPTAGRTYRAGESIGSSTVVYAGPDEQIADGGLVNGATYHYRAFTFDGSARYSAGVAASATPTAPLTASACPAEVIVDNLAAATTGATVTFTGRWSPSSLGGAYGRNGSLYSSGRGSSYTWQPPAFSASATCTYQVSLWWVSATNRSGAVPVRVAGQSAGPAITLVNQQAGGGRWQPIGVYSVAAGRRLAVTVTDAHGMASADAARFVLTTAAPTTPAANKLSIVIDNGAGATSSTGAWCQSGIPGALGGVSLFSCGTNGDSYRWTPTIPLRGTYDVYVMWTAYANRSSQVPISVAHAGGTTTKRYDQRLHGGTWQSHGRYTFDGGAKGYVAVSDAAGLASADAVRLVPVP